MSRFMLILATLSIAALVLAFAPLVNACPPQSLSLGYCAPQAVYAPIVKTYYAPPQPIVAYAPTQPVYAPLQEYAPNQPAQITIVPGKLTYTAPQTTYTLGQVQGEPYAYPLPAVAPSAYGYSLAIQGHYQQQNLGAGYIPRGNFTANHRQLEPQRQNFSAPHAQQQQQAPNPNEVVNQVRGPLGITTEVQADGDLKRVGPLGRTLRIVKN